ncbi:hypothetical protein FB446DRAFT_795252 [Lentinula raphanica]|nr:hypothetical protein FB446DRAFT_795252 [Lentinula raphanica]
MDGLIPRDAPNISTLVVLTFHSFDAQTEAQCREEVECVPLFSVWESSTYPSLDKGYVQDEYWDSIVERTYRLRKRANAIRRDPRCSSFPNFPTTCPGVTSVECNSRYPGRISFEDMVSLLSKIQEELKLLAAWIRMAEALLSITFMEGCKVTDSIRAGADDSLVGVWVNGLQEEVVSWFADLRVPLFVCHEIRGQPDSPEDHVDRVWVKDAIESSELVYSAVLKEWTRLYKGPDGRVGETWEGGYESQAKLVLDKLEKWRSSSRATKRNFPGEDWGEVTETPMDIEEDSLLPPLPKLVTSQAGYAPWILPPPVQPANLRMKVRHYVDDWNDQGERCFKYTSQQDLYSSYDFTYVDRQSRRYLHMDSRLFIAPEIVHPVGIYGLPGPRLKFYDDFHCKVRARSSFWVYEQEIPRPEDVGKAVPDPPVERLRPTVPIIDEDHGAGSEEERIAMDVEARSNTPDTSDRESDDQGQELGEDIHSRTIVDLRRQDSPETGNWSGDEVEVEGVPGMLERGELLVPHMVSSVIPSQTPVCTWGVTPFVKILGIGHVELTEFREWLRQQAPTLRVVSIARTVHHFLEDGQEVGRTTVIYVKFWDRRNASSFRDAFQNVSLGGTNMTIEIASLQDYKQLKKDDLIDYWDMLLPGKLNPLVNRLKDPLLRRISNTPQHDDRGSLV